MSEPTYTHLVRSYDGAGKADTSWHTSYAEAVSEQIDRAQFHFDVVVMPVIPERVTLASRDETVTAYREAANQVTRKAMDAPKAVRA